MNQNQTFILDSHPPSLHLQWQKQVWTTGNKQTLSHRYLQRSLYQIQKWTSIYYSVVYSVQITIYRGNQPTFQMRNKRGDGRMVFLYFILLYTVYFFKLIWTLPDCQYFLWVLDKAEGPSVACLVLSVSIQNLSLLSNLVRGQKAKCFIKVHENFLRLDMYF